MSRTIVLGCVCLLLGVSACSGDDDGEGGGDGDSGSGAFDNGGSGTGSGSGSGTSGSGSGSGSGTSGSGSGTGSGGTDGSGTLGDGGLGTSGTSGGTAGTDAIDPNALLLCGGEACQCADGEDNDGDGTEDGFDIECTGPFDDDEGSFATGISGDNMDPKWQDCFFDGNSGAGDDGCRYHTDCLTGDLEQDSPSCSLTDECVEFCSTRTPPGCDCFGCCTVATDDGPISVITNAECDASDLGACATCVKSEDCDNECGECELCVGVTVNDLPDECFEKFPPGSTGGSGGSSGGSGTGGGSGNGSSGTGGASGSGSSGAGGSGVDDPPGYMCDDGARLCREQDECPPGYYCQFGCCKVVAPE